MTADDSAGARLDSSLARTAEKYDSLPYQSKPIPKTHPGRMAAVAHLFGLDTPPLASARVLELGCAAGGNIIPLAAFHPEARFLGIDLGKRQIDDGMARITDVGLTNIELRHQSITDLDAGEGPFDYIICHGVFSWVPDIVKDAILRLSRQLLSPDGIAYVSYNVLPGWRMYQPLRDALALMIPDHHDDATRVRMARRLLEFMKTATPDGGPYGELLRAAPERLAKHPDDYIFHEYMEEINEPSSFGEFTAAAARNGLAFLGECDVHTMFGDAYGAAFAQSLASHTSDDVLSREQMIDVLTGRTFRQTLLVASERHNQIKRNIDPARMEALRFHFDDDMRLERESGSARLIDVSGASMATEEPAVIAMLERLFAAQATSLSWHECMDGLTGEARDDAADALRRLFASGMICVTLEKAEAAGVSDRPVANPLARADAKAGREMTANARHEAVLLDPAAMVITPYLDGAHDAEALLDLLYRAVIEGRIAMRDLEPGNDTMLRERLRAAVPLVLAGISEAGILTE